MLRSMSFGPFGNRELRKQVKALNFYARFINLCKDNSFQGRELRYLKATSSIHDL